MIMLELLSKWHYIIIWRIMANLEKGLIGMNFSCIKQHNLVT